MQLNRRPLTLSPHRWILLRHPQVDTGDIWVVRLDGRDDASCHMFQQLRGHSHLAVDQFIKFGIVQRIIHQVGLCRTAPVIAHPQGNTEPAPYPTLLRQNAVERIEAQLLQLYVRTLDLQFKILNSKLLILKS